MKRGLSNALLCMTALAAAPAAQAQDAPADTAGIHTALRAFYFSLGHRDWEAIAGQVLSAKVVAHRPPPDAMVAGEAAPGRAAGLACGTSRIRVDGACAARHRDKGDGGRSAVGQRLETWSWTGA